MNQFKLNLYEACRQEFVLPEEYLHLPGNYTVKRIKRLRIVNDFLNLFHYLHYGGNKSIGPITRAYGLYNGGELLGVIVYNPPGSPAIPMSLFGRNYEVAEFRQGTLAISRLAVSPKAPFNATGYLISSSLKLIWEDNLERERENKVPFRTIVTFADTLCHTGTVYRAQNAWYAGVSPGSGLGGFYNPETGEIRHVRQGKVTLKLKDCPAGWLPYKASDKLKYLFFLGGRRIKLETMSKLSSEVKFLCKVGTFSVFKEGKITRLSDERSYEDVYRLYGRGRNDNKMKMIQYSDYLEHSGLVRNVGE